RTYVPSGCRPGFAAGADFTAALAPAGGRSPESAPAHAPSSAPATTRNRGVTAIFKLTSTRLVQQKHPQGEDMRLSLAAAGASAPYQQPIGITRRSRWRSRSR